MTPQQETWLLEAYTRYAHSRDHAPEADWKLEDRAAFLGHLQALGAQRLLDLGAGPGRDAQFFAAAGLLVISTDLVPAMVRLGREKGLPALVMDARRPALAAHAFDAVWSSNSLLHLPTPDLPPTLTAIRNLLRPGGLFHLRLYGGKDFEGIYAEDRYRPKRFFRLYPDDALLAIVSRVFEVRHFDTVTFPGAFPGEADVHAQLLTLRRAV